MATAALSGHAGFDIDVEVRYRDALVAAVWPSRRRAVVFAACFAVLAVGAWTGDGFYDWAAATAVVLVAGVHLTAACVLRADYRRAGGRPRRMLFHVCESGIEIRGAGRRNDWIDWDDLAEIREIPGSFLIRPSGVEQYVVPKRCLDPGHTHRMREALRRFRNSAPTG